MKTVHFAEPMNDTPFQQGDARDALALPGDITVVDDAESADVIVGRFLHSVAKHFELRREYYVWTHEPRWCAVDGQQIIDGATGQRVHVSTAWNLDIYTDPLYYFPAEHPTRAELSDLVRAKSRDCAILATYRSRHDRFRGSVNVDLSDFRQRLAIGLQQRYDYCDIYGRTWPGSVVLTADTRGGDWQGTKHETLRQYAVNIACENTILPNYVTEKIWDAIRSGCVPVYFARGSGIRAVLDEGSFVDCSDLTTAEALHDRLASMSLDQRLAMVDSAWNDMDRIARSVDVKDVRRPTITRFFDRIRHM